MTVRAVDNIGAVLAREFVLPMITLWNRLEGQPRRDDFSRALRAEIRDPLWMLSKQWQMGEFEGDDAASPIFAKLHAEISPLTRYQSADHDPQDFPDNVPLETLVERRPVPLQSQGRPLSLDIRLALGRRWMKMLGDAGLGGLQPTFLAEYSVDDPDPSLEEDAVITAHAGVWQSVTAVAGRLMDGGKLYERLTAVPPRHSYEGMGLSSAQETALNPLETDILAWFNKLFYQPVSTPDGDDGAWIPPRLEYQFSLDAKGAQGVTTFRAEEYHEGHLDWYNLDADPQSKGLGDRDDPTGAPDPSTITSTFLPVNVQFDGMPNTRWWAFEDGKTNLGAIKPDSTDLGKLIFMEFGLVYANDWFLLPLELPIATLTRVRGIAVTNVFGERVFVEPAVDAGVPPERRWAMFLASTGKASRIPYEGGLLLLPTAGKVEDGKPFDDVRLVRDEVSNMVWGVEARVPVASGVPKPGTEAGKEYYARLTAILDSSIEGGLVVPDIPDAAADLRYELMRAVPENWIPFIPVHKENDQREIQLQRASMPRIIIGRPGPPEKVKPRTQLLRQGLDQDDPKAMFVFEEEVPRAGVRVTQGFQRTRWHRGEVFVWVGVRKETGRGEGSSGLAFDRLVASEGPTRPALEGR
jgi:hypothetical protein